MQLKDLKAVVTGSGGLMGGPIAVRLAELGADVALNDRIEGRTDDFEAQIRALGRDAVSVTGSVTRADGAEALIGAAMQRWGRVDILVNTVGGIRGPMRRPFWEMEEADWDATMAINTKGTFLCSKLVLPGMMERRFGKIVNIASIAWAGNPDANPAYVTAKAGIVALTRALASALRPYDINVNAIAPGVTNTRIIDEKGQERGAGDGVPLSERVNEPSDIAEAVAYLVSPGARNVSGQLLTVAAGDNPSL